MKLRNDRLVVVDDASPGVVDDRFPNEHRIDGIREVFAIAQARTGKTRDVMWIFIEGLQCSVDTRLRSTTKRHGIW